MEVIMRVKISISKLFFAGLFIIFTAGMMPAHAMAKKLYVVAANPTYADMVKYIAGDLVKVDYITKGDEDPHFVRPKPSFVVMLSKADVFVATGLDLELWAPGLIDKSMNGRIRQGQPGYVAVYDGIKMLQVPDAATRSQGGVHLFGNPHIHTSPMNAKIIAKNIAIGLCKNDAAHCDTYKAGYKKFNHEIDIHMFGKKLLQLLGSDTLTQLATNGKLIPFLKSHNFRGKPLADYAGGWAKKDMLLWGKKMVTYHENWIYFATVFGLRIVREVEPKPAIPPSPKDIEELIKTMRNDKVPVIFAGNFYDESKIRRVCEAVHATPVIVAFMDLGKPGIDSYFKLVDSWLDGLLAGYKKAGVLK